MKAQLQACFVMKPVSWSSQFRCYFSVCMWQHLPGMSERWAKCLRTFQIKISTSPSQASEVVINGGNLTLFETAERHFHNMPERLMDSCASMIYTLHSPRKQKKNHAINDKFITWKCDQVNLKTIIATWYLLNIITNIGSDFNFN